MQVINQASALASNPTRAVHLGVFYISLTVLRFGFRWDESSLKSRTQIGFNKCTALNSTYLVVSKRILVAVPKSQTGQASTHCFD